MCRFIYRVTPFILHLLKLWHISHAFSNFHLHLSDRNLDNPSPGNIQITEIRCKIEASSLEINRLIDYPRSKVSTKTVTTKFRCRISVVRSHANDRAALDAAWCKTEFDFHWSTRSVDSIPRKTVTATPRKIDFWLESNIIGLHSRSESVAWAFDYSIESKIYTLHRFDLLFFGGYFSLVGRKII